MGRASSLSSRPSLFLILLMLVGIRAGAQTDTVRVPSDSAPGGGNLNAAVRSAAEAGNLSRTVFVLEPSGYYILSGTIAVPAGERLTIVAPEPGTTQATAPPQIVLSDNLASADSIVTLRCLGQLVLKNVWVYYANTRGEQMGACLQFVDSPDTVDGQRGIFDGVIFDYSSIPWDASGAVDVTARHFRGTFRNCYFKNCVDLHFRYYGRAVSFPYGVGGRHIDSLLFENCTFANMGYVYMQEMGNYGDNVQFNHCTFVNVVMYPLESGWWYKLSVTNSIFFNTWMYGHIPMLNGTMEPVGGTVAVDSIANFGFTVPFTEQDRRILFANSSYFLEEWLRDWMENNPASVEWRTSGHLEQVPVPQPMLGPRTLRFLDSTENGRKLFPYMNRANLYDSTDPGFLSLPTDYPALATFLFFKWWCSADTLWAYAPERSFLREWPMPENLAYTNQALLKAGMGGFPLGDLYRWFPEEYAQWKAQKGDEEERIFTWMSTGIDPGSSVGIAEPTGTGPPGRVVLCQNFPNPFNATTQITFVLPEKRHVSLKVYNVLGQLVATLIDQVSDAGSSVAMFDGTGVAGGVYFYRLRAGNFEESKKLILLK
jgi:hypothetical protein